MPHSRELSNKKNDQKDRHSRGKAGSDVANAKKGGAGAHNWGGLSESAEGSVVAMDRHDPNYDSSEETSE